MLLTAQAQNPDPWSNGQTYRLDCSDGWIGRIGTVVASALFTQPEFYSRNPGAGPYVPQT